ncbi:MAG: PilN domain-containing protein [Coxiellaceae bacterium]|nr:PilN domain-containing protein [Coxiellaceae bacterium]
MANRQDVNLLLTLEPPKIEVYLPIAKVKKIFIGWGVLLILVLALGIWSMFSTKGELDTVTKKREQLARQVEKLKAASPKQINSELQRQVDVLTKNIESKSKLVTLLNSEELDNIKGYSGYMKALSDKIPQGVWLTEFQIGDDGIVLIGKAQSTALVAQFAGQLHDNELFAKLRFKHLDVDRDQKTKELSFELATSRDLLEQK